jgi:hypothetical protein
VVTKYRTARCQSPWHWVSHYIQFSR